MQFQGKGKGHANDTSAPRVAPQGPGAGGLGGTVSWISGGRWGWVAPTGTHTSSKGGASFTKRLLLLWYKTASKAKENVVDLSPPAPVDLLNISKREGEGKRYCSNRAQVP